MFSMAQRDYINNQKTKKKIGMFVDDAAYANQDDPITLQPFGRVCDAVRIKHPNEPLNRFWSLRALLPWINTHETHPLTRAMLFPWMIEAILTRTTRLDDYAHTLARLAPYVDLLQVEADLVARGDVDDATRGELLATAAAEIVRARCAGRVDGPNYRMMRDVAIMEQMRADAPWDGEYYDADLLSEEQQAAGEPAPSTLRHFVTLQRCFLAGPPDLAVSRNALAREYALLYRYCNYNIIVDDVDRIDDAEARRQLDLHFVRAHLDNGDDDLYLLNPSTPDALLRRTIATLPEALVMQSTVAGLILHARGMLAAQDGLYPHYSDERLDRAIRDFRWILRSPQPPPRLHDDAFVDEQERRALRLTAPVRRLPFFGNLPRLLMRTSPSTQATALP